MPNMTTLPASKHVLYCSIRLLTMATVWTGPRVVPSRHPTEGNTVFFAKLFQPEVQSPDCPADEDGAISFAQTFSSTFHLVLDSSVVLKHKVFQNLERDQLTRLVYVLEDFFTASVPRFRQSLFPFEFLQESPDFSTVLITLICCQKIFGPGVYACNGACRFLFLFDFESKLDVSVSEDYRSSKFTFFRPVIESFVSLERNRYLNCPTSTIEASKFYQQIKSFETWIQIDGSVGRRQHDPVGAMLRFAVFFLEFIDRSFCSRNKRMCFSKATLLGSFCEPGRHTLMKVIGEEEFLLFEATVRYSEVMFVDSPRCYSVCFRQEFLDGLLFFSSEPSSVVTF